MAERRARSAPLVALLLAAGCGGGEESPRASLTGPEPKLEQVTPKGTPEARPPAEREPRRERKPRRRAASKPRASKPGASKPGADLPGAQRRTLVDRIAPAVVMGLGFGEPKLTTDGSNVTVAVARAKACALGAKGPATLAERLRGALPFARSLRVVVQEDGKSLAAYAATACEPPKPPAAPGRLVFEQDGGPGNAETKTFTIGGKKWTVTYANNGEFFQAFAVKDGKVQSPAISATKRGKGSQTFKGPGTFTLRITGSGDWSVQVRDGD